MACRGTNVMLRPMYIPGKKKKEKHLIEVFELFYAYEIMLIWQNARLHVKLVFEV